MSATDELRLMLDERGVSCQTQCLHVSWRVGPKLYDAVDNIDGTLTVSSLTPEQAVTATLGGGECEQVLVDCDDGLMLPFTAYCSKCGNQWGFTPKFCPECGAMVVGTRDERKAVDVDGEARIVGHVATVGKRWGIREALRARGPSAHRR